MKVLQFGVSNIEGCPDWLKKLFEFSVQYSIKYTRISRVSEYVIVMMKISDKKDEEVIKRNFPFKADFHRVVRLALGGTVLVAEFRIKEDDER